MRYFRFEHHCPGATDWRIGSIGIRVWTEDGAAREFESGAGNQAPEFQVTLPQWRRHAYGPMAQFGLEDSDGDGSSDIAAYAYGVRNGASPPLSARPGKGEIRIAFTRNRHVTGLEFPVFVSSDCAVWSECTPSLIEVSDVPGCPELEMVECAIPHNGEFDRKAFVKVEVREVE